MCAVRQAVTMSGQAQVRAAEESEKERTVAVRDSVGTTIQIQYRYVGSPCGVTGVCHLRFKFHMVSDIPAAPPSRVDVISLHQFVLSVEVFCLAGGNDKSDFSDEMK